MSLSEADRTRIERALDRHLSPAEAALFENLWSEHCAYRSSRPLLSAFESDGERVVVGPGDDAAVVRIADDTYITMGVESHNHPSYVDPYDGAATGVGGIVRDTLSMGAYPIALADSLYFGAYDDEHSQYLLEGVVDGISDYGNAIGVPTVTGSTTFHEDYEGNPLVNVACVGLLSSDRLVTADAKEPGNKLVLVGNATGRDGLGGASFASEDLDEDAATEDRPAVQVGDPYSEKLLVEANETLLDEDLVVAARDLGAAGFGGASTEMIAKGELGAEIELERVHQREPNMSALEILLAESQERMCYEVRPDDVAAVTAVADRYDLGCSVVGEVTDGDRYVCTFYGETVVDAPAELLADGAPMNDLDATDPVESERSVPDVSPSDAFEAVVASPNTASKRWVYRQYDHEVGVRTSVPPGDDAAVLAIRDAEVGLALSSGANPLWTDTAPYAGGQAAVLENATNLAAKGAQPLAAVDCLNGGNPEKPDVYGAFTNVVNGVADMAASLDVPVVGGNVSLYNDSVSGPIPPTPTIAMTGIKDSYDAPPAALSGDGTLLVVGDTALAGDDPQFGGSAFLAQFDGTDRFPSLPDSPAAFIDALASIADADSTLAVHDISHGGLAVALAEMITEDAGAVVTLDDVGTLVHEQPGRAVIETTDPQSIHAAFEDVAPVATIGEATADGVLDLTVDDQPLRYDAETIADLRNVLERELA